MFKGFLVVSGMFSSYVIYRCVKEYPRVNTEFSNNSVCMNVGIAYKRGCDAVANDIRSLVTKLTK